MSFLRPSLGRNGHDAPPAPDPAGALGGGPTTAAVQEARSRALGIMSAEVEHLAEVYADALRDSEERLARAHAEIESLRSTLRALRALLDTQAASSESVP